MSCIYRDQAGKIILMCKGADSVIYERLSRESANSQVFFNTKKAVDIYAEEGLRTLYLAKREIPEDEYQKWN
jgi:phospholipid-translocating ATPase